MNRHFRNRIKQYFLSVAFCIAAIFSFGQNNYDSLKIPLLDSSAINNKKLVILIDEYDLIALTTYDLFFKTLQTISVSFQKKDSLLFGEIIANADSLKIQADKIAKKFKSTDELYKIIVPLLRKGNCFIFDREFKKLIPEIIVITNPNNSRSIKYKAGDKRIFEITTSSGF